MPYNLLRECWIPVRRKRGAVSWIAPHQIAEVDDPPVAIASPRPDFDGALIQFLIGLMQTAAAPKGKLEWEERFEKPHTPEQLEKLFAQFEPAFNLDGEGPRFMQDLTLATEPNQTWNISDLLIGSPGEKTIKDNGDLFEKRGRVSAVSLQAAAMALLTLQLNSPEGGGGAAGGHKVSIRGGGPLTTIAVGATILETVWLNTIERATFESRFGNPSRTEPGGIFPWQGKTRSSDKKLGSVQTTPEDVHPLHQYWAMPRRIRLVIDPKQVGACDLLGNQGVPLVSACLTTHSGFAYSVGFRHPLSPYSRDPKKEEWRAIRSRPSAVAYSSWPTNVLASENSEPARALSAALSRPIARRRGLAFAAFGFETKQESARAWVHGSAPLVATAPEHHDLFRTRIQGLVEASESVRRTLLQKVKEAIARRPKDLPGDLAATTNAAFWSRTEAAFFETVTAVRDSISSPAMPATVGERWLTELSQAAKKLFESYSQLQGEFAVTDVKRVAKAWNELCRFTSPDAFDLRKAVGLPVPENQKPKRGKRKKKDEVSP